jgi:hypothetical protein
MSLHVGSGSETCRPVHASLSPEELGIPESMHPRSRRYPRPHRSRRRQGKRLSTANVFSRRKTQTRQSQCHEPASGISLQWLLQQPGLRNEQVDKNRILLQHGDERTDCFTGTTSPTSAACFDTVLLKVGIVSMARAWVQICFGIVVRALVLILDKQTDGSAEGDAMFRS